MSQTFELAIEAGPTEFAFMKAQRVISLKREPPTPAPLNLLSLPSDAVCAALWALRDNPPPEANSNEADLPSVDQMRDLGEKVTEYIRNYQPNDVQDKRWCTKM